MLAILSIISLFSITNALPTCPGQQIGAGGANIQDYYLVPSPSSFQGKTIAECDELCYNNPFCKSFAFDQYAQWGNTNSPSLCKLFKIDQQNSNYQPDQVLCRPAGSGLECPDDTAQVGTAGTYLMTYVLSSSVGQSLAACQANCVNYPSDRCGAFTFDDDYGSGSSLCLLHEYDNSVNTGTIPSGHPRDDQIVCTLDNCPAGSTQIGGAGEQLYSSDNYARITYSNGHNAVLTIEKCESNCINYPNGQCKAFVYDADVYYEGHTTARCSLYATTQQLGSGFDFGDINANHPRADQILCGIDAGSSAQSSGLFNLDGVDGNGESVELSVYIIYGVIGLVLANIICLTIHCWRKCGKGDKRKYKVVSMASDADTDIECQ